MQIYFLFILGIFVAHYFVFLQSFSYKNMYNVEKIYILYEKYIMYLAATTC